MSSKSLKNIFVILFVTFILVTGFIIINSLGKNQSGKVLNISADSVIQFQISRNDTVFSFSKENNEWSVNGSRADNSLVNNLIAALVEAEKISISSSSSGNFGIFEISDKSYSVTVANKVIVIGKNSNSLSSFINIIGEDNVYNINKSFSSFLSDSLNFYRSKLVTGMKKEDVKTLRTNLVTLNNVDNAWKLADNSTPNENKLNEFLQAVVNLNASSVLNSSEVGTLDERIFDVELSNGTNSVSYSVYKVDNSYYAANSFEKDILFTISEIQFNDIKKTYTDLN